MKLYIKGVECPTCIDVRQNTDTLSYA